MKCLLTQAHRTGKKQSTKWRLCIFISVLPKLWELDLAPRKSQLLLWYHGNVSTGHWASCELAEQALQSQLLNRSQQQHGAAIPCLHQEHQQHWHALVASQIWCSGETASEPWDSTVCSGSACFSAFLSPSYHIPYIIQSITLKSPVWLCLAQFTFTKPPEISIQLKNCPVPFKKHTPSTQRKLQCKTSSLAM